MTGEYSVGFIQRAGQAVRYAITGRMPATFMSPAVAGGQPDSRRRQRKGAAGAGNTNLLDYYRARYDGFLRVHGFVHPSERQEIQP